MCMLKLQVKHLLNDLKEKARLILHVSVSCIPLELEKKKKKKTNLFFMSLVPSKCDKTFQPVMAYSQLPVISKIANISKEWNFVFVFTYFVSCNGPCALQEKWHRTEHIIIIIYINTFFKFINMQKLYLKKKKSENLQKNNCQTKIACQNPPF